ncbi:alcohol dehydrogenase catalytic domain-containing protein [Methanomethylovorans sp.]|uniref:alcohol dehydrogenase catalytic domain-containing protein n=1 Tax=Methanomethylovorans sp. TaxID=2758717 RepID=UPI00351C3851
MLVKVELIGLDGTDREINEGLYGEAPKGEDFVVIGHESLGIVERVGHKVNSLKRGDMVFCTVRRPDGFINCQAGEFDLCLDENYMERGIRGHHGLLSEYYSEEERFLVKVPEVLGNLAVLLEPANVAEKAIRTAFAVQERMRWEPKTAMVMGTGVLGLITAMLLKIRGFDIVSVDRSDNAYKDMIFREAGIIHFNTGKINLHNILMTLGRPIDLIVEETGSSSVALHSMMVVGNNGVVVLTSITGGDKKMEIFSDFFNQGLVLGNRTVVGSLNTHRRDFYQGIKDPLDIQERWPFILENLITARYPPEKISEAFEKMESSIKVLIDFGGKKI